MRTVSQLFNEDLPAALTENAEDAKSIGAKFQFNILGEGEWHLDLTKTGATCVPGNQKADCTVSISNKDFQTLLENPEKNAMSMYFTGKLKVAGNQMLGLKLKQILGYLPR